MKQTIDEHAARFDDYAPDYDERHTGDDADETYLRCAELVIEHAAPDPTDVVLDLGIGTGAIGLELAVRAKRVVGRDISTGMLAQARANATERGIENVEFGQGRFREPNYDGPVAVVVSNFALHHLSDDEKRAAIEELAALEPRRFVLGDVMFFGSPEPEEPIYGPAVDDPATVGVHADALTDAGFSLTAVEAVHDQAGVLVAERATASGSSGRAPHENDQNVTREDE